MSAFSQAELDYLAGGERRLGRIATVGKDGTPHVVPVGFRYNAEHDAIDDLARSTRGGRAPSRCAGVRRRSPSRSR